MVDSVSQSLEKYMDVPVTRQSGFNNLSRGAGTATPQEVIGLRGKNDGNNVDIDRKARLLSKNSIRFNAATNLMKGQLRRIKSAIHEGQGARASFFSLSASASGVNEQRTRTGLPVEGRTEEQHNADPAALAAVETADCHNEEGGHPDEGTP